MLMKTKRRKDRKLCKFPGCSRPALFFSPSKGRMVTKGDGHSLCQRHSRAQADAARHKPLEAGAG